MTATRAYQEANIRSADSVELVIMLHDMLIDDLRHCIAAIGSGEIQVRCSKAAHALAVLDQLQLGLDQRNGGDAAQNMAKLYSVASVELVRAQIEADAVSFGKYLELFSSLRTAWQQAQPTHQGRVQPAATVGSTSAALEDHENRTWSV